MLSFFKMFFSKFLGPLIANFAKKAGFLILDTSHQVVKEISQDSSLTTWRQRQDRAIEIVISRLQTKGLQLGVDFYLNEVIAGITSGVAKLYDERSK